MRLRYQPILIIGVGFVAAAVLMFLGPTVDTAPPKLVPPLVRAMQVNPVATQLVTHSYGTVVPRTESELVPEVDGRVSRVSDSLVSGGFFSEGDILLEVEPLDYEVALEQARAGLARSESDLSNAEKNYARQQDLVREGAASDSQLDDAFNRVRIAEATLRESMARLSRAERDLARTNIVAPYDGRVRQENVDVGQFVRRGSKIATIYATDFAEVRVPIHDEELAYIELPLTQKKVASQELIPVVLRAKFAGRYHEWQGHVVRTEGELDRTTRMVNVVVQVPEPYAADVERPPLAVGLFVEVEIIGKTVEGVVTLPRSSLLKDDRVLIVDTENRLSYKNVDVLRRVGSKVLITGGLQKGDLVCLSSLPSVVEGMEVRLAQELQAQTPAPVIGKQKH